VKESSVMNWLRVGYNIRFLRTLTRTLLDQLSDYKFFKEDPVQLN
jgi:hypothetical protein